MKIASWNVNSLKVRLPQVLDWLKLTQTDVLCVQETKLTDEAFPIGALQQAGYQCAYAGQKTFNGVAIISKAPITDIATITPLADDDAKRLIVATIEGIRFVCAYVPFGESVFSDKYQYKLRWLNAFETWLATEIKQFPQLAFLGDMNIAPEDRDIYNPALFRGQVPISQEERLAFQRLQQLGLIDAFRQFEQQPNTYSCWDYRMRAFQRNLGMRIDHILLSQSLANACSACHIDKTPRGLERPSDHAPILAQLDI